MKPSIGRIVHYKLNKSDAQDINRRRHEFMTFQREYADNLNPGATGHIGHTGNAVRPGDVYPAMIVRVFEGNPHDVANLQVHLDGNDSFWATSRHEGNDEGEWAWPVIESPTLSPHVSAINNLSEEQIAGLVRKIQAALFKQAQRSRRPALKPEDPD